MDRSFEGGSNGGKRVPRSPASDVLVLCYHAVSERWVNPLAVTPERLRRQLEPLVRHGYRGATFYEAVSEPRHQRTLAVTFDDAYRSVRELALPVLEELDLPGTVFVPTDFAGSPEPMAWPGIDHWLGTEYEDELRPLAWEQLDDLASRGWEVGSHTRSHPRLVQLDDDALGDELAGSRQEIEARLGLTCTSIAYPYGAVDARVVAAAASSGYAAGAALPAPLHRPRALEWPRMGIYAADVGWRFRLKTAPRIRRLRHVRLPVGMQRSRG